MLFIYISLILLAALPAVLIIFRMRRTARIKKTGVHVNGIITQIRTVRVKASQVDILTLEYTDRNTGRSYQGKATAQSFKYKTGDHMGIAYLPANPAKYAVTETRGGYTLLLVFCILLFLFVLFAVYKIDEMTKAGAM